MRETNVALLQSGNRAAASVVVVVALSGAVAAVAVSVAVAVAVLAVIAVIAVVAVVEDLATPRYTSRVPSEYETYLLLLHTSENRRMR